MKNVAEKLELNITATPYENVTDDILNTAVEMYTYLIVKSIFFNNCHYVLIERKH